MRIFPAATAFVLIAVGATASAADMYKAGDLVIGNIYARATQPGAKTGGGYLTITNTGTEADRLTGASLSFAGKTEIHQMKMENDVMKMRPVEGGLEIAPGKSVKLAPDGYHFMFMKLEGSLNAGESHKVELEFDKAGTVEIDMPVLSLADTLKLQNRPAMKHGHTDN